MVELHIPNLLYIFSYRTCMVSTLTFLRQKLGEEFDELSEDHPLQLKFKATGSSPSLRTLNDVFLERSKKKLRVLRAIVNYGKTLTTNENKVDSPS